MDAIKELKNNNLIYYLGAFFIALVVGLCLVFVFDFSLILGKVIIQYWYFVLIALVIILLLRKRKNKSQLNHTPHE